MDRPTLQKLIDLRAQLISDFNRLRDYKNNKNAIMKEAEHAMLIHRTIKSLDDALSEHVEFTKNEEKR